MKSTPAAPSPPETRNATLITPLARAALLCSVVVARGLALRVEETRPVLGLELCLKVPVDEDLSRKKNK